MYIGMTVYLVVASPGVMQYHFYTRYSDGTKVLREVWPGPKLNGVGHV